MQALTNNTNTANQPTGPEATTAPIGSFTILLVRVHAQGRFEHATGGTRFEKRKFGLAAEI